MAKKKHSVQFIVIDGGPCGGKTTVRSITSQRLIQQGVIPVFVPESATILINAGISFENLGGYEFQKAVLNLQLQNENLFKAKAQYLSEKYDRPAVVICDRGILSGAAYLPGDDPIHDFRKLIKSSCKMDVEDVRTRYTGVVLLRTAADGAVEKYTTANNEARKETPEEAIERCNRTMDLCWLGHPHVAKIMNVYDGKPIIFDEKIDLAVKEMFRFLGLPAPREIEDRYLLKSFEPEKLQARFECIEIEQTYLISEDVETQERVRMRDWLDSFSFAHNKKKSDDALLDGKLEYDRGIIMPLYLQLLKRKNPSKRPVIKTRYCFFWEAQYFEADVFHGPLKGLFILERERRKEDLTKLPPFLNVIKDITHDKSFSNFYLADK